MTMKVEIVSRELIKPSSSSSNPQSGLHKLSLLDQIAPHGYNPIVLFYSSLSEAHDFSQIYDALRISLSKTLNYVCPLAGRVKDEFTIECNDEGVDLVVADVSEDMSCVLCHPQTAVLRQLLPVDPETKFENRALLMVQVNRFACGGLAIGLCINHVVADAMSMTTFITTLARINRHVIDSVVIKGFDENIVATCFDENIVAKGFAVMDCTSLFPPRDINGFSLIPLNTQTSASRISTRRLVFDGSKIAALKERVAITQGRCSRRPSRVEVVSALVWEATIEAFQKKNPNIKTHVMLSAIDLRSKMQPPLPRESIGNIFYVTDAKWEVTEKATVNYESLVGRVQESIQRTKESSFTSIFAKDEFLNAVKSGVEQMRNSDEIGLLMTSSICRFPVYEIDFGFGKPEWVGNGIRAMNVCIMGDTENGNGIEAILGLTVEHMHIVEHNPNFLQYVSFIQPV